MRFILRCLLCGAGVEIRTEEDAPGWTGIEEDEETALHYVGICPDCTQRVTVATTRHGEQ